MVALSSLIRGLSSSGKASREIWGRPSLVMLTIAVSGWDIASRVLAEDGDMDGSIDAVELGSVAL